jgi:hypothetical protein
MTGPQPAHFAVRLPRLDDAPRLRRFQDANPGAVVAMGRLNTLEIAVPEDGGTRYIVRRNLGELVDRLGELYGEW